MELEKVIVSSKVVEVSETNGSLNLKNRVCFYGEPNKNGVMLPYDDSSLSYAQTLVDMPVYAHYIVDSEGKPSFTGHEMKCDPITGEVKFGTEPIGVHTEVEISEDLVDVNGVMKTLPCLFATQKIWTRNKNAVAATMRLFEEGKLHTSWEICSQEYSFAEGIKTLNKYYFVGNTFLGTSDPAYGPSAKILSISSLSDEYMMVAEALSRDMVENGEKTKEQEVDDEMKKKESMASENPEVKEPEQTVSEESVKENSEPASEEVSAKDDEPEKKDDEPEKKDPEEKPEEDPEKDPKDDNKKDKEKEDEESSVPEKSEEDQPSAENPEVSTLTDNDLRDKLYRAMSERDMYPAFVFPEEHEVWAREYRSESELDMVRFTYSVDGDHVNVSEGEKVRLSVSIREMNNHIASLQAEIESKNSELSSAAVKIGEMETQISELAPYKKKFDDEVASAKKADMLQICKNTKLFKTSELENEESEIRKIINDMDESAMNTMIAQRFISSVSGEKTKGSKKETEVSTVSYDISTASAEENLASSFRDTFFKKN